MSLQEILTQRCSNKCELCSADGDLSVYEVQPGSDGSAEKSAMLCAACCSQIGDPATADGKHWRCLNESMWSEVPAVQVLAWRMLTALQGEDWSHSLLESLYLDEDTQQWAKAGMTAADDVSATPTRDSNGTVLVAGDTVTVIKDLVVKGGGFTAKRGTTVKNIRLTSNPEHIEGRVNGTQIVLISAYLKKTN
jgi:protein PhnA